MMLSTSMEVLLASWLYFRFKRPIEYIFIKALAGDYEHSTFYIHITVPTSIGEKPFCNLSNRSRPSTPISMNTL